ncbi:alpha/beta fold hydrolase [Muricoccus radiodurans]|uniref:alpha/beta fold hydrolase n=1 Tax=Muricoccus radiodurans TaxID=2231721 RepID=UPI003CF15210
MAENPTEWPEGMGHDGRTRGRAGGPGGMNPSLAELEAASRVAETPNGAGRVVWHEWGAGKPLVMLHGGAGSWRHWARNIPFLSRHRRVLAPDTPGLGESDLPPPGTGIWDMAAILADGIAARIGKGTRYDLVGFSFGSVISGHIAARHAEGLDSVTLSGAGALGIRREVTPMQSIRDRVGEERTEAHRANLASLMIADPARIDALALEIQSWNSDRARFRSRNILTTTSLREALEEVPAELPVHVIYGERDAIAYPNLQARADLFQQMRPGTDFRLIPGAGHWVAFEAAERFNAALADILGIRE